MINRICLVSSFLLVSSATAFGKNIDVQPKITHVTVYSNNAMIEKEGLVSLKKGENTITVSGLTASMINNSLQIRLEGGSAVRISDIKVEQTYLNKSKDERKEQLQSKIDEITALMKHDSDEIAAINSAGDFLKKIVPFAQNQKVMPAELEAHTKFLEQSLQENYTRIARIESSLQKRQEEKARFEKELTALNASEQSKNLQISLTSLSDMKDQKLEISYLVNNARWTPLYIVYADSASEKIEWSEFASLSQSSGEEWKDAVIEISTAKPFSAKAPDPLSPWYIDVYRPYQSSYAKSAYEQPEMMGRYAAASAVPESFAPPAVKQEAASFSFVLPGKNTIPSDNQPHKIFIASEEKGAQFYYRAIPKLSPFAYLTAVLNNPFTFPLLPGETTVLLDGKVVGIHTSSKTVFPEEEIFLSLGADESIKIEHKQKKKYGKDYRMLSKATEVSYSYANEISNGKEKPVRITVDDQFPISQNEQIKVVLNSPQKEQAKISEEGIISWDIALNPHEKKVLPVQFTLTYPKKIEIDGID